MYKILMPETGANLKCTTRFGLDNTNWWGTEMNANKIENGYKPAF